MSRITLINHEEAFKNLRAAMETDLTLQAISKERIHQERAADLQTALLMAKHGVKVLRPAGEIEVGKVRP